MENNETLYMQIYNYLKDKINNRELLPGQQVPTEMELAAQFSVSRITSKKALEELEKEGLVFRKRGKGTFVSLPTAKLANSGMNKVISIIFPYTGTGTFSGFVMSYINGAMSYLAPKGYYLSIHCTEGQDNIERGFLRDLPNSGIGGIIYYPASNIKYIDVLSLLCFDNYPIVTIDKKYEGIPLPSVVSDNFNGQYKLTEHLIKLGHRRIAYLTSESIGDKTSIRDRYLGYCKALKDNDIKVDTEILLMGFHEDMKNLTTEEMRKKFLGDKINYLLNLGVTAILTENDLDAINIVRVVSDMGLTIPKDISIAGFDDAELLEHLDLKLTTVKQDFYELGRRAAQIVVKMIEEGFEYINDVVPTELVIRDTTGIPALPNDEGDLKINIVKTASL